MSTPHECHTLYFNPRSPRGLRQSSAFMALQQRVISIHAAQEGCDCATLTVLPASIDFNPRSPRGLRLKIISVDGSRWLFQSTQPKRAATKVIIKTQQNKERFQSTQPKRAATNFSKWMPKGYNNFNPRSPRGLRPKHSNQCQCHHNISIHAAQEGCDKNHKANTAQG